MHYILLEFYLYFLCNIVTLCECHGEIKGWLLTYLLEVASNTCTLVYRFVVNQCTCKTYRSDAAVMDPASISATQLHAVVCRPSVPCLSLTRTKTSTKVSTPSVKKQTPMTFWLGFIKKAQTSVISDRDSCTLSVHVHLQVTSLMLLRTICSFHGNDSRRVGAVG